MKSILRKLRRGRVQKQKSRTFSRQPIFEHLEPRVLLDADINGLLADQALSAPLCTEAPSGTIEVGLNNQTTASPTIVAETTSLTENVAAGKTATQSSTGWGGPANYAVDDNTDGDLNHLSVTHTQLETNAWWQVDLGQVYSNITNIEIWNRTDFGPDRLDNFYVFVSDTPFTSTDLSTTIAQAGVWSQHITTIPSPNITLSVGRSGRYVRVQLGDTNYLSLAEVKVFAEPAAAPAQSLPYTQDFSSGQPNTAAGWEYYSDNEGRIQVTGGRLRMDDTTSNSTYSLNEAILHLNLTGQTGVTLTLDHWSMSDENDTLPSFFTGHYKGDGIALSVDGVNWVTITSLSGNFTNGSFALDAIIAQAKTAAGSTDISNVRIKFQQYDNEPTSADGREFDNIRVTANLPEMEITGNGQVINDGDTTPVMSDYTEFGYILVGTSWTYDYTITNTGTAALNLTSSPRVQLSGSSDFSVIVQPASTIAAGGGTTTFHIQFTPTGPGTKTATVTIANNDSDENPYNFVIQGTGIVIPEMGISGNGQVINDGDTTPSLSDHTDFSSTITGTSIIRTFTITNTGTGVLNLTGSPRVILSGSEDFTVITQPTATVAPSGGTTTIQIRFTPTSAGTKTTTVTIANNDSDENPYNFVIQGSGIGVPEIETLGNLQVIADGDTTPVSTDHTDFGSIVTGSTIVRTFTIRNTGTGVLNLTSSPKVQISGSTDFTVIAQPAATVAANGGTTTFQVQFAPTSIGTKTATIQIYNDDSDENPYNFTIQGTGTATGIVVQTVPYTQNFDAGKPGDAAGWEYHSDIQGRIQVTGGRLRMDDITGDATSSLNEAILHLNLTGKTNVTLTLDHVTLADENDALPTVPFTGQYKGDGIALSVDGINWITITSLTVNFTNGSFALDSIITQAMTAAGSTDLSNVRIKFQQYDNYPASTDGREFDNIRITASIAQAVPYTQDFSAGLPSTAQGWEYYSDNEGRIQVVDGSLTMDDTTGNTTVSLNEAILHVNLTGKTNVTLTLDHTNINDDYHALPASFSGHYKGDGISLSVDGTNWVRITSLDASFTGQSFALDAIIAQAKTAAGITDVSDVRIKFQQYDDWPVNTDGRSFDNIHVTSVVAQTAPSTQNFDAGIPTGAQGWEFYSDNQGGIQVTGGRLRMYDTVGDTTYSLNEATLHLNLTGKTNVTLTLDHYSQSDEDDVMPASFTGHYKGDGISLSVDGINWVTITSLSGDFTNGSFALDTIIAQAMTAAGSTDLSNVRIKFQQYDNYPVFSDGREFDNIRITAS
jgi:hypothetical protein